MRPPVALAANSVLIPFDQVARVEIGAIEHAHAVIVTLSGERHDAYGFDAIEAVMALKPSALEGRRLRWKPHAWAFHNLVAHPVLQLLAWIGLKRAAIWVHDVTTPVPRGFK